MCKAFPPHPYVQKANKKMKSVNEILDDVASLCLLWLSRAILGFMAFQSVMFKVA